MITMEELLSGNKLEDQDQQIKDNLQELLSKINVVRKSWNKPMTVTSGLRSEADQQRINPSAPKSGHLRGECCDIADSSGELREWILSNLTLMEKIGFWFEDFRYTKGWVHFSIRPPKSGKRIFIPKSGPIPHPELWDGKY
jgi:hypothetical protein